MGGDRGNCWEEGREVERVVGKGRSRREGGSRRGRRRVGVREGGGGREQGREVREPSEGTEKEVGTKSCRKRA